MKKLIATIIVTACAVANTAVAATYSTVATMTRKKNKKSVIRMLLAVVISVMSVHLAIAQEPTHSSTGRQPMRAWGPEQATGEPDTHRAGDMQTAWASLSPDGQNEWLMLTYKTIVTPAQVRIYETYNPGAVVRVAVVTEGDEEVTAWEGNDPVQPNAGLGVAEIPLHADVKAKRVKVYLDSVRVRGWNEIDAVQLVGVNGTRQWAIDATASSTYAEQLQHPFVPAHRSADEFKDFLQRSVTVHLDGSKQMEGILVRSGPQFLVLRRGDRGAVLLVNKDRVLYAEVGGQPSGHQP